MKFPATILSLYLVSISVQANLSGKENGTFRKLDSQLNMIMKMSKEETLDVTTSMQDGTTSMQGVNSGIAIPTDPRKQVQMDGGYIFLDVVANHGTLDLVGELTQLGCRDMMAYHRMVSAFCPIGNLERLASLKTVLFVSAVKAYTEAGSVLSEGVNAMNADIVQNAPFGLDGTGLLIGVLSDSYNFLNGEATDIATGDLRPDNLILNDFDVGSPSDEGRAMMQLITDVAPGARQVFHTAFGGQAAFAMGILTLADAGCKVIVDDITYFREPYFQDGVISQAIDEVRARGVSYFSAAGNRARQSYESVFRGSGVGGFEEGELHNFDPDGSTDTTQTIVAPAAGTYIVILQWDDPYASVRPGNPGAASDLDLIIRDNSLNVVGVGNAANIGFDPVEIAAFATSGPAEVQLSIELLDGPAPGLLKIILSGPGGPFFQEYATNSATLFGHKMAAGGAGVGAAEFSNTPRFGQDPPLIEIFSSAGGIPILFDIAGTRLAAPEIRSQPRVTGPDGSATTVIPRFEAFFGTSAAAPHVAAVAALMLQQDPNLTPEDVFGILKNSAIDMDDPATAGFDAGFDFGTGNGLVNALTAVEEVIARTSSESPSAAPSMIARTSSPSVIPLVKPANKPTHYYGQSYQYGAPPLYYGNYYSNPRAYYYPPQYGLMSGAGEGKKSGKKNVNKPTQHYNGQSYESPPLDDGYWYDSEPHTYYYPPQSGPLPVAPVDTPKNGKRKTSGKQSMASGAMSGHHLYGY